MIKIMISVAQKTILYLSFLSIIGVTPFVLAQTPANNITTGRNTSWTKEDWSADETAYKSIRNEIWEAVTKGQKDPVAIAQQYKIVAQQNPKDPIKLFSWATAAYRSAIMNDKYANSNELINVMHALEQVPFPHSYEFARIRFLIEARNTRYPELIAVGERLIDHNPKDAQVLYRLASTLDASRSEEEKQSSLKYITTLMSILPNFPNSYSVLGSVYYKAWLRTKSQQDADQAISAYEKYLQLAPAQDSFRQNALSIIKIMKQRQNQDKS